MSFLLDGQFVQRLMRSANTDAQKRFNSLCSSIEATVSFRSGPDFIGKNLPTSGDESVSVTADGVVIS